ncbi:MAG: TIGR01244 family sulfur transferase [Roseobacter sp.]
MDIRKITPRFFAAPQISVEDLPQIAASGITRVVCNRPDVEVPPSHQAAAIETAARAAGLEFCVLPLTHQTMTSDVVAQNYAYLTETDGPVLAYCASGTRSTIAWALASAKTTPIEELMAAAQSGGYDLSNLRQALEDAAKS